VRVYCVPSISLMETFWKQDRRRDHPLHGNVLWLGSGCLQGVIFAELAVEAKLTYGQIVGYLASPSRKILTPKGSILLTTVDELIDPATGNWDEVLIIETFQPHCCDENSQNSSKWTPDRRFYSLAQK
jgi:hypothetical protein